MNNISYKINSKINSFRQVFVGKPSMLLTFWVPDELVSVDRINFVRKFRQ